MRQLLAGSLSVVWLMLLPAFASAQTELRVFTGGAMSEPVREVGNVFAKSSGHRIVYVTDTTGALSKRLLSGERADVIVVTSAAIQALEKDGRIAAGSRVDLARALIGVGVKAGAPSPDLSTTEAFKAALLKAKTVSYVNPASGGTSGTYFEGLLQKMGIAAAMKPKTVYRTQGSEVAAAVAAGAAELGITFTSELAPTPGVKVAGTLPADIQLPTIYAGAVVANAGNADAARAFIRALAGADGRTALKKAGLEPVAAAAR
jgi:molybdate transport system substrate-binding protein